MNEHVAQGRVVSVGRRRWVWLLAGLAVVAAVSLVGGARSQDLGDG